MSAPPSFSDRPAWKEIAAMATTIVMLAAVAAGFAFLWSSSRTASRSATAVPPAVAPSAPRGAQPETKPQTPISEAPIAVKPETQKPSVKKVPEVAANKPKIIDAIPEDIKEEINQRKREEIAEKKASGLSKKTGLIQLTPEQLQQFKYAAEQEGANMQAEKIRQELQQGAMQGQPPYPFPQPGGDRLRPANPNAQRRLEIRRLQDRQQDEERERLQASAREMIKTCEQKLSILRHMGKEESRAGLQLHDTLMQSHQIVGNEIGAEQERQIIEHIQDKLSAGR